MLQFLSKFQIMFWWQQSAQDTSQNYLSRTYNIHYCYIYIHIYIYIYIADRRFFIIISTVPVFLFTPPHYAVKIILHILRSSTKKFQILRKWWIQLMHYIHQPVLKACNQAWLAFPRNQEYGHLIITQYRETSFFKTYFDHQQTPGTRRTITTQCQDCCN